MKDADHRPAAIVAARKDRGRQQKEPPHEVERLHGSRLGDLLDNGLALRFQDIHQSSPVLPIDERLRAVDRRQPFAHLLGNLGRTLRVSKLKLKPKPALGSGITGTDFDHQFGEPLGAERFRVLRVEGSSRPLIKPPFSFEATSQIGLPTF